MKRLVAIVVLSLGLAACASHGTTYDYQPDVVGGHESNCGTLEHYRWIQGWSYSKTGVISRTYVCPTQRPSHG